LKKARAFAKLDPRVKAQPASSSNLIVFIEKSTGVAQFRAESCLDSEFGVERLAGLVAMQCLIRGSNPDDFIVLVPAERALADRLVSRAKRLLEEGRAMQAPSELSPRQREVLHSVICNRANKEIASKLNITVRTVKFHISNLLNKFGVQSRAELARRAAGVFRPTTLQEAAPPPEQMPVQPIGIGLHPVRVCTFLSDPTRTRTVRFPERVLPA
jgi:DNA-binding CsgD family transcriptional regulator